MGRGRKACSLPEGWYREDTEVEYVYELDLLVLCMVALTTLHAWRHRSNRGLFVASLGLGFAVETASLRLGGTHCHASGLFNFTECSSLNSILYYLPWVYACVTAARRLVDDRAWSFPIICGALMFGMCGIYEMQGPMMGWWLWPDTESVVKAGWQGWQLGNAGQDDRGLVASPHVYEALEERVFGFPVLAPYFHFAFGWGIATALQLLQFPESASASLTCVLLGPALGMVLDPVVRIVAGLLGAGKTAAAPAIMVVGMILALVAGPPLKKGPAKTDPLLFGIAMLNQGYFVHHALVGRGAAVLPPQLKMLILSVSVCATVANARACGFVSGRGPEDDDAEAVSDAQGVLPPKSFLDRLQEDAQKDELDHTNTNPAFFLALASVQLPAVAWLAGALGVPVVLGIAPIASHVAVFFLSHYVIHTDKFFDITGEATFFPLIAYSHVAFAGEGATDRQKLATGLALVWCARLGIFLGRRIFVRGSDWRFEKLMNGAAYNFFGWVCQGTWIFLQGMCLWVVHTASGDDTPLGTVDYVGVAVWAAGLTLEHVADLQKSSWNATTKSGQQKTWLATGVWKYSRHPNFFGESLLWVGTAIVCAGAVTDSWAKMALCFVSPAWSAFFLFFTSLMLLEKRLDGKFGSDPKYIRYKRATSVLVPWFSREAKEYSI